MADPEEDGRPKEAESRWNICVVQYFSAQCGSEAEPARAAL
jgi:hypothetical protein